MILKKLSLVLFGCTLFTLTSCIQDEPLNAECDIIGVDSVWLKDNSAVLIGNPVITNTSVSFTIAKGINRTQFNPSFYLTAGSRITMEKNGAQVEANGATRDFTVPQIYTTHSEDGNWSKQYTVSFNYPHPTTTCSFEHYELDKSGRYYVWYEMDENDLTNPRRDDWSSGNAGFAFTGKGKTPNDYPTCIDSLSYKNFGIVLTTRSTGSFGSLLGMPIAAGNIFIGEFKAEKATTDALKATQFGKQEIVGGKPLTFSGYYKYKAGTIFTNKENQAVEGKKDICDIYSVLYKVDPNNFVALDGSNSLTSDRIIAMARINTPEETDTWTKFELPFVYKENFDVNRLHNNGYAIAIVATSSRDGAYFEGAVGSTLHIDEIKIAWEE